MIQKAHRTSRWDQSGTMGLRTSSKNDTGKIMIHKGSPKMLVRLPSKIFLH